MTDFLFNDIIKSHQGEYFLKTSANDSESEIISSFLQNGTLLETRSMPCDPNWDHDILRTKTRQFHQEKKGELQMLLELSKKLKQSDKAEMRNMLGQAFARRHMYQEAIIEFEEGIKLNPNLSSLYNELGCAYTVVRRYDHAITALEQATAMSPEYADYQNNLGVAYLKKEHCRKAVRQFIKAIDINTYYADAYFNLGMAYVLNGLTKEDFALSVDCYHKVMDNITKAIKVNPGYHNQYAEEGEVFLQQEKYEEAYFAFEKAQQEALQPADTSFITEFYLWVLYSGSSLNRNFIRRHIRRVQDSIQQHPSYADLYNHLGVAYVILSKYINYKASQQFKKAIELNPEFERASRNQRLSEYDQKGMQLLFDAIFK